MSKSKSVNNGDKNTLPASVVDSLLGSAGCGVGGADYDSKKRQKSITQYLFFSPGKMTLENRKISLTS